MSAGMKLFILSGCLFSFGLAFALQTPEKPGFEVASIKPSDPNSSDSIFIGMSADRAMVTYTNITLKDCIRAAYRVRDFQIAGPDWVSHARYEITAKLPAGASPDQIPEMLQTLLAERFRLTLEREMKEQPVYALLVGKEGPKLKPAPIKAQGKSPTALGPDGKPRPMMMFRYSPSSVTVTAPSATLAGYAELLSRFTARPVLDMTGIEGQYEFNLVFQPEAARGVPAGMPGPDDAASLSEPAPPLSEAVKTYGLRLDQRKAPLAMLTVTHAERNPTEN
jgi:uncharacterized protein (TIGR03435 family)